MLRKRLSKKPVSDINVVPYIDVMLVLLVIFIVTAPLLQQGVNVDLPQASANALSPSEKEPIVMSVDKDGNYYLNIADNPQKPIQGEVVRLRVMAELERHRQRKVLVKADANVDYGKVMKAMVLLQQAGAPSIGLVTQDDNRGSATAKSHSNRQRMKG